MAFSEEKKQHLEFLQNIITRMNTNSFQIKSIATTITTGFLAIYASTNKCIFIFIPIFPLLIFWFLDSYYLQMEKKFRGLYNDVAKITTYNPIPDYEMSIKDYKSGEYSFWNVFISKTIIWMYFPIILSLITAGLLIN